MLALRSASSTRRDPRPPKRRNVADPAQPSPQEGRQRRVLVIEDDEDLRNTIEEILAAEGFLVQTLPDGTDAAALHRDAPFDLIVTDIFMPNRDGIETICDFRQEFPETKIIAMSVDAKFKKFNFSLLCRELGVKAVLKPFAAGDLLQAVHEVLPGRRPQ
jgi:DNA-binding response OmpR family regulator